MTTFRQQQYDALAREVGARLDLDAGLADVFADDAHPAAVDDVATTLDLAHGLADILAADLDEHDVTTADDTAGPDRGSRPAHPLAADLKISDVDRLRMRTHPHFARLCDCLSFLARIDLAAVRAGRQAILRDTTTEALAPTLVQDLSEWLDRQDADDMLGQVVTVAELARCFYTGEKGGASRVWLRSARVRFVVGALSDEVALAWREVTGSPRSDGQLPIRTMGQTEIAGVLGRLRDLTLDFTTADLRAADLSTVNLDGVMWSPETRWPDGWAFLVTEVSEQVAPGLFVIRHGGVTTGARLR